MASTHRVRTLLPFLEFTELKKEKILPKKTILSSVPKGGSFPSEARKMGYVEFGLFLDHLMRKMLAGEEWYSKIADYPEKSQKWYTEIYDWITGEKGISGEEVTFEPEWEGEGGVIGHPDVICDNVVYDIKTSGRFNAMRSATILQILSYYCLAQINGLKIDSVGVILPAQKMVISCNLEGWDWVPFYQRLMAAIEEKMIRGSIRPETMLMFQMYVYPIMGTHIHKNESIYNSITSFGRYDLPMQIYLQGCQSSKTSIADSDIKKTRTLIEKQEVTLYVHSPHIVNLSKLEKDDGEDEYWTVSVVLKQMDIAKRMGAKGVVVHCGIATRGKLSQEEALDNMRESVSQILKKGASEECKLILETSAREGGELLADPEDFAAFYHEMKSSVAGEGGGDGGLGICVDSCHVFAAGYDPNEFIAVLEEKEVPIDLIHYNDSKHKKGSCKDRHAPVGRGHIGLESLCKLGMWASAKGVPLVTE